MARGGSLIAASAHRTDIRNAPLASRAQRSPIASFLVVSDPDPARRDAFVARAATSLAPVPGLRGGRVDVGCATIVWRAAASAPVSVWRAAVEGGAGAAGVVWGDALGDGDRGRASASDVARAWTGPGARDTVFDGFHAAAVVRADEIVVGADLLGLFPVYYAAAGEVRLVGSSAEPFRAHPLFRDALDVDALLGHLLTGGPFDGRGLLAGVRRLAPGALLRWRPRAAPRETVHYTLPEYGATDATPFADQVERFDAALMDAVRRHAAPHPRVAVLLSGGRDSRMLAGYLGALRSPAAAVTLGVSTDNEARCAAAAARALGVPHHVHAAPYDAYPRWAERSARWEQLGGGMSSMHTWGTLDALQPLGDDAALMSGYLFDIRHLGARPAGREAMLAWAAARALGPDRLRALLRDGAMRARVADVSHAIARDYDATTADPAERSWRWFVRVYCRFHAGSVPWRLSFAAWPVLPVLDRALFATTLALPHAALADRRLQDALFRQRFPELARLPFDHNAHDVQPLTPSFGWRVRAALGRLRRTPTRRAGWARERRYYVRVYDFDNPGWRAVREAAEPARPLLAEWFDPAALAELVPPPARDASHRDPIRDGFGPKLLVGFMLWRALRGAAPHGVPACD